MLLRATRVWTVDVGSANFFIISTRQSSVDSRCPGRHEARSFVVNNVSMTIKFFFNKSLNSCVSQFSTRYFQTRYRYNQSRRYKNNNELVSRNKYSVLVSFRLQYGHLANNVYSARVSNFISIAAIPFSKSY